MMDTSRSLSHPSTEKEEHPMTNDDAGGRAGVQGRRRRRAGQRRRRENALFTCVLAASVAIGGFWALRQGSSLFLTMQAGAPGTARGDRPPAGGKKAEADASGWNLILVNRRHPLPGQYETELVELPGGESVDARIYSALQEMFEAMQADGVYPVVASGYRTADEQQRILDERIAEYQAQGYSDQEARAKAEAWVALPGASEHQLGLAADINADGIHSAGYEVYDWLEENSCQYGFIRRYPEEKTEITGVENEPWHYRYVGVEAATDMKNTGLCLEEYLEAMRESGR